MERVLFRLKTIRINLNMSKSGYRWKSGNCNKPFRRFQHHWDEEPGCSGTGNSSRNVKIKNSEHSDGRKGGFRFGQPGRDSESAFGKRFNSDTESSKTGSSLHTNIAFRSELGSFPASSSKGAFGGGRPKHPPGLKGKEIGLWYSTQKKKVSQNLEKKKEKVVEVLIGSEMQTFLEEVLHKAGTAINDDEQELLIEGDCTVKDGPATFENKINSDQVTPAKQDPILDRKLFKDLRKKKKSSMYLDMANFRKTLPAFSLKDEIVDLIEQNQVVVVSGGTGCGKTTQIVQYVLDHYIMNNKGSLCNIVCTQPRRISAVTVAERVAAERAEPIGHSVGYQIRLQNMVSVQTKGSINFMTTGVLLSSLESEPLLNKISHLFLDEIHERNIDSDLMMALLKYIMPKRPDLKIILMSATLNENSFCTYFSNAPKINIPGLNYPVEEIFLEDILQKTGFTFEDCRKPSKDQVFNNYILPYVRDLEEKRLYSSSVTNQLRNPNSEVLNIALLTAVVRYICENEENGAILVFLPGISDITAMKKMIMTSTWYSPSKHIVTPIHSILATSEQRLAFDLPPPGVWKIVLGTTIVESSVTINDIRYVVDCGKAKFSGYDIKGNVATLGPSWISLANAKQRQGRAGRTKAGKCYKAYTKIRQEMFDKYPIPESQTTSLEEVILKAKLLQLGHVAPFLSKLMDPPDPEMVELSLRMLRNLNILDSEERLTSLGYHVSKLPMHPRTGKMILMAALFNCIDPVVAIAACLSFKDPFVTCIGKEDDIYRVKEIFADGEKSDHFIYSEALRLWEKYDAVGSGESFAYDHFLSVQTIGMLSELKKQFAKILHSMNFLASPDVKDPINNVNSENRALVKAIVCAGLYPNIAFYKKEIKKNDHLLMTPDQKTVLFHLKSYLNKIPWFESPFFVYHLILKSTSIHIHDATMIPTMPLLFFGERLNIENKDGTCYLHVDDNIKFKSNKQTGFLVKCLRKHLDRILEKAILNPEEFRWHNEDPKTEILSAITTLLSSEDMTRFEEKGENKFLTVKYVSRA